MVNIDLKRDIKNAIIADIASFLPKKMFDDVCYILAQMNCFEAQLRYYYSTLHRIIRPIKRKVYFSPKLISNTDIRIQKIAPKLTEGENINSYLSKKIGKFSDKNNKCNEDLLLWDWNIHHIHLSITGTSNLIFAFITEDAAYLIDFGNHKNSWTNIDLIETLHNNWPELLVLYKAYNIRPNILSDCERNILRKNCVNTFITTQDNTNYNPIGRGYSVSGSSMLSTIQADKIILTVKTLEKIVLDNEYVIRKGLKVQSQVELKLELLFRNGLNHSFFSDPLSIDEIVLTERNLRKGISFNPNT